MRHEWIFDVLNDLQTYAEKNGLTQIATETGRLLITARAELTAVTRAEQVAVPDTAGEPGVVPANTDAKLIK
jgi:hypothetical protein